MASTEDDPTRGVADLYQKLTLEEEGGVIDYAQVNTAGDAQAFKWCIVGRFLTDKSINFLAMKNTLASVWQPVKGVCIKNLGPNLYLFQFFHDLDVARVLRDGPWNFDQHLLVMANIMKPQQIPLFHVHIWVQVHDLPSGFMSESVARDIGNFIGGFVETDPHNFTGIWRSYMRVRVSLDVRKPLKRRMKIKISGEEWSWANFKYEKLPTFCFFCGILGHVDKFCEAFFDYPDKSVEKFFGIWLRAPSRRQSNAIGERWLRTDPSSNNSGGIPAAPATQKATENISRNSRLSNDYCPFQKICDGTGEMVGMGGKDRDVREKGKITVDDYVASPQEQVNEFLLVVDPKRRRVEEFPEVGFTTIGPTNSSPSGPNNFLEAGSALQARQSL